MANIDNLNFKAILDDKEFNSKLQSLEKDARKFNSTMSNLLNVKKAGVQISQKEVENNRRALQAKVDEMKAQEKINREKMKTDALQKKLNKQTDEGAKKVKQFSTSFQGAAGAFMQMVAFTGMASLVKDLIRVTGEFELQKVTLGAMLNDMAAAERIIGKIRELSVMSPFTASQLSGYTKQLSAFGVPADELFAVLQREADLIKRSQEEEERFIEQMRLADKGDDEAMIIDQDFLRALQYGMPPTSGIGIGIDRLVMLMTGKPFIQEVLFFTQMKPEKTSASANRYRK